MTLALVARIGHRAPTALDAGADLGSTVTELEFRDGDRTVRGAAHGRLENALGDVLVVEARRIE